jgi:hypothetical protein
LFERRHEQSLIHHGGAESRRKAKAGLNTKVTEVTKER